MNLEKELKRAKSFILPRKGGYIGSKGRCGVKYDGSALYFTDGCKLGIRRGLEGQGVPFERLLTNALEPYKFPKLDTVLVEARLGPVPLPIGKLKGRLAEVRDNRVAVRNDNGVLTFGGVAVGEWRHPLDALYNAQFIKQVLRLYMVAEDVTMTLGKDSRLPLLKLESTRTTTLLMPVRE